MKTSFRMLIGWSVALVFLVGCGGADTDMGESSVISELPVATSSPPATSTATPTTAPLPPEATPTGPTPTPLPLLVEIPAGEFAMGSDEGRSNERPVHLVYIDRFFIDRTEVTNAEFSEFLNDQGNQVEGGETWLDIDDPDSLIIERNGIFQPRTGFANHPVIEVTWYGARAYCEWRGRDQPGMVRLPTEAEWEKAAAWDEGTSMHHVYPWGDDWFQESVNADTPIITVTETAPHTMAIGSFPSGASPYGVLDMSGNVWEWVADWYGLAYYAESVGENPAGPSDGADKVVRGGSWRSPPAFARTSVREHNAPDYTFDIGIRCVTVP
jgi:formylglycine-generating enzyme required for sulfatase activity